MLKRLVRPGGRVLFVSVEHPPFEGVLGPPHSIERAEVDRAVYRAPRSKSRAVWKSTSELGYASGADDVASMAWKLHAVEQTQLRRKYRVDGEGARKFDFHRCSSARTACPSSRPARRGRLGARDDVPVRGRTLRSATRRGG